MNLTSPSQVKAWCIENGFHPNKVLGQNFLIDQNALKAIVDAGLENVRLFDCSIVRLRQPIERVAGKDFKALRIAERFLESCRKNWIFLNCSDVTTSLQHLLGKHSQSRAYLQNLET